MKTDFNIVHISQASKLPPCQEYILTYDSQWDVTSARVACKHMPNSKVIALHFAATTLERHDMAYETFMNHLTELQGVYESLIDEQSKKTFCGYWLGNISHQFGELVHANTPHYIADGFIPEKGAIVIAAGACDGGTASFFADMGLNVYTFEMNEKAVQEIRPLAEEKNFIIENMGIGAFDGEIRNNGYTVVSNGSEVSKITTIDTYVREKKLPQVDFIQLDVEGSELDVLRGASGTIARFKPILALSAYHKWDDFWTLMNFVKSIRSDYEFALRQYPETVVDMPSMVKDVDIHYSLGIEPDWRDFFECVLFAR